VSVSGQESERHVFVCWGSSIVPLSVILIMDFGTVPTLWQFLYVILLAFQSFDFENK
jgi:hypothetical protein